mgnify:CR=1 FL=1
MLICMHVCSGCLGHFAPRARLASLCPYSPGVPLPNAAQGHRFRSRVFVDIGDALTVPPGLLSRYLAGGEQKRAATDELMKMVNSALTALTISAPDYETLEFFWTLRRLIKTSSKLSLDEQTELACKFAAGYDRQVRAKWAAELTGGASLPSFISFTTGTGTGLDASVKRRPPLRGHSAGLR